MQCQTGDLKEAAPEFPADGSGCYENGVGITDYRDADGSYTIEEGNLLYHYDA